MGFHGEEGGPILSGVSSVINHGLPVTRTFPVPGHFPLFGQPSHGLTERVPFMSSSPQNHYRAKPVRRAWLSGLLIGLVSIPGIPINGQEVDLVQASLPELLEQASGAFASGDFATAADRFSAVERDYGEEAAWQNGDLPRRILPLLGFAELKSGQANAAVGTLSAFLERYPDDQAQSASVRYALAIALQTAGREDAARLAFQDYLDTHPGGRQATLARFQLAELFFASDQFDPGLAELDRIRDGDTADSLKLQARLLAVQRAVEHDRTDEAVRRLLAEPWTVTAMPEIAVLAFAGLDLGDQLMAAGRSEEAIRAYGLVPPRDRLIELQRARLAELQARIRQSAPMARSSGAGFWIQFYENMLARIIQQLAALEEAEDYTPALMLRRAQAFLLVERAREAWLLCEYLAIDESLPSNLREEAHYRWILAASALERWEDALAIARSFVERHPDSERAPGAFYSMAQAHLEQRRLAEADDVLTELIERFSDHDLLGRFFFLRGYVRTLKEAFSEARTDFEACGTAEADRPLAINAGLWHALTWFFERNYPVALKELEVLQTRAEGHVLYPEIHYRIGTTTYAQRDYSRAELELTRFLDLYPGHDREAEALVLLGDTLMGSGGLDRAMGAFRVVPPEKTTQATYATFQIGKILKAQEDLEGLSAHFRAYAAREEQPPRVSEALYWVGWAEDRLGHPERAEPVFKDALQRFGNDPEATEIMSILQGLARLHRRSGEDPVLFIQWVEAERVTARQLEAWTAWARLTLYLADRHLAADRPYAAEALELEIAAEAPVEALGPFALGRVGRVLMDIGAPSAATWFDQLLVAFPQSFDRAYAWYGYGCIAAESGDEEEAVHWLDRCSNEAPAHPVTPSAMLAAAEARLRLGQTGRASEGFNQILAMKSARGRLHAKALRGLAEAALQTGDSARAIACFQRIYTLYQAYEDLVAEAYFRSAGLFEERGDLAAAYRSYLELTETERLRDTAFYEPAITARDRLAATIETLEEPAT